MRDDRFGAYDTKPQLRISEADGEVLARAIESQNLELKVDWGKEGPKIISGAVDAIKWGALNAIIGIARQSLVLSGCYRSEDLMIASSLVCDGGKWNPVLELTMRQGWKDASGGDAKAVIGFALAELMAPSQSEALDFHDSLHAPIAEALRKSVGEVLQSGGGRVFSNKIRVEVKGEEVAQIKGHTKPRPDLSVFTPKVLEWDGVFQGFRRSREIVYFEPIDHPEIEVAIGRQDVDLIHIGALAADRVRVRLRLHQTKGRRGVDLFAFVRIVDDQV